MVRSMSVSTDHSYEPLAILGMACRLPGADNLQEYWRLIVEGRSAVAEVPPERFDQELYYDAKKGVRGKSYSKLAAVLSNCEFDHASCPIPDELVQSVDRTHLLMTAVAADALRQAGLNPFPLQPANTAVFIGHAQGSSQLGELTYRAYLDEAVGLLSDTDGFRDLAADDQTSIARELVARIRRRLGEGRANVRPLYCNMVAGTIAKAFGLSGSWLALNAACASSLHAMLLGARALQLGRAEMVIVGGASDCKSDSLVLFSQAQTLSTGGSRPFDADADGLVMSEGYVALVMKTLERALADGDPIQAVVRGLGVASDGRGKSLWAPRKEGQMKAMLRAYRSGVEMSGLEYLEAHATSTQVGDATELETLGEVLSGQLPQGKKIPITSVKANIGHALEAAGMAGVIKTVLCMQHQTIPPAINIESLNPKVNWQTSPYYIPMAPEPWKASAPLRPRRAAVNAFGIGGLNMHVVLDEFTPSARQLVRDLPRKPAASADDHAVAIVGMGCVFPGAIGLPKFWEALVSALDPKSSPPAERWTRKALAEQRDRPHKVKGGFVTGFQYDWRRHKVPPKQVAEADPLQFMLLDAAEQALLDAGYDRKPFDRQMCGVVVGTEFGGDFCDHLEIGLRLPEMQHVLAQLLRDRRVPEESIRAVNGKFGELVLGKWPSLVDETGSFTSSTLASRITKTLDLAGGAVSIDSGSTSALSGLAVCLDMLLSGDNELMICAAGQRRMGPNIFAALETAGLLAGSGGARNLLDAGYDGIVPGEGVGVIVLKRLADARRDGDRIHAIIRGLGIAHHPSHAEALRLAAERSCAMAGVDPGQVTRVELDTDEQLARSGDELKTLTSAGHTDGRHPSLTIGSLTAQFGHLGGAAGMAALMKATLEIEHGQSVPTVGLRTVSAELNGLAHAPRGVEKLEGCRLAAIASWSKGLACHVILERATPVSTDRQNSRGTTTSEAASQWRICRFAATTPEQLLAELTLAGNDPAAAWRNVANRPFAPDDRFRLAIVADSAATLGRRLKLAGPQFQNPAARQVLEQQGIFYRERPAVRPRVAFVFPGQGSQYDGMLRELVRDAPAAAAAMRDFDATMTRLGYPTFSKLAWETPTQLGSDVWSTQVSILLADAIVLSALGELGIAADLVLGHSYGEFVALYAAGAWDLETAVRMTRARCDGIVAVATGDSGMLATDAPQSLIETLARDISIQLYLANLNAPDQTVVGGKRASLEALAKALEAHSHQARMLSVPAAFHTPLMAGASRLLEQQLRLAELGDLKIPMISTVTNAAVRDASEIRRNLAAQLTTPVRYRQLISQLAADEPTVFVEVGPQQTMTRLNRRIVDAELIAIACDNPKRPGVEPLLCVQALLECLGAVPAKSAAKVPSPPTARLERAAPSVIAKEATSRKSMNDPIPHFDATERRRAKMRSESHGKPIARANGSAGSHGSNGDAHHPPQAPPPVNRVAANAAAEPSRNFSPAPANGSTPPAPRPARPAPAELESFLINFVVEQTGYPAEVVDLDADLEADLGIDSIKKAQLFGELQEYFDVAATATNLSLDDFPTLRHVVVFLQGLNGQAPAAPVAAAAPASVPAPAMSVSNGRAAPLTAARAEARDAAELESFLINFVVEQTGYPAEVVDLDADLEADLGIDSIKKAQLFGELQEYFDVGTTATNLSLDDFPTLRHVVDFLVQNGSNGPSATDVVAMDAVAVVTAAVAPAVSPTNATTVEAHSTPTAGPLGNPAELESFLINFVVEQTGYPAEVVELDADLEADLGIDSIKKAQLFGELQEYFEIPTSAANLSLDDFPTLRHVLDFLAQGATVKPSATQIDSGIQSTFATPEPAPVVANSHSHPAPVAVMDRNGHDELSGSSERAVAHGLLSNANRDDSPARNGNGNGAAHGADAAVQSPSGQLAPALRRPRPDSVLPREAAKFDVAAPDLPAPCVTNRFVLEMRDAPLSDSAPVTPQWSGPAIVLGADALADALRRGLKRAGVEVHDLPLTGDVDRAVDVLQQICTAGPAPHLFITTGRGASAEDPYDEQLWSQRRHESMLLPFFVCQKWLELATAGQWLDRCTLVAATGLGGDLGFERGADAAAGGALAGLLKAIYVEYAIMQEQKNLRVKAIDAPADAAPDRLCENIFRELASGNLDFEVAYVDDRRRVPFAVEREVDASRPINIRRGGTWVVTGGARGITAACALELGRRFGLKLHLIGTTPATSIDPAWRDLNEEGVNRLKASVMIAARQANQPAAVAWQRVEKDLEIDRSLRAFAAAGVSVTYHACDVSDRAALAQTLDRVREIDGPIEGILHGAGIDRSCRLDRKQRDVVSQTIGAKVDGAANLMALTRGDAIRHFIAFGSISGRLGSFGQADYCLASDMLCKLVGAYGRSRPWVKAIGFHWHPWDEVGMAARPETKSVLQGKSDLRLMPPAEGIAHLLRELASKEVAPEVLITERRHWERFAAELGKVAEGFSHEASPAAAGPEVELHTHRCQLRTLIAPLPSDGPQTPRLDGAAWIVGDNPAAAELAERLNEMGCLARRLVPNVDLDQTLAEVERLWAERPAKHLFLMTGRDTPDGDLLDAGAFARRREQGVLLPFFIAQRWYKLLVSRGELGSGTLAAAVSLGGNYGFDGRAVTPDGGSLAGLLKAVHIEDGRRETSRVRTKVIDAPADEPVANLIDAMLAELAAGEPEVEVCWSRGTRRVVRPLQAPLASGPARAVPRGGTWVVTGGARGITAIAARELARRYGWKLHLIGKSPPPQTGAPWRDYSEAEMKSLKTSLARQAVAEGRSPSEAWDRVMKDVEIFKNLRGFSEAGVDATYHACDVANREALAEVLDEVRRQSGPIQGILHGAGVIDPSRFEGKRRDLVRAQIGAKFDGTLNLMALAQGDPLAYFIGFGSISGRFGGNGLTDYAAGNDALAKLIDWFRARRPNCRSTCIHWESWEGSGMATLPRFAWGPKSVMNMKYMLPEEGVRRLEQELQAGFPDSEVLYTFGDFYPMFYPREQRPLGEFSLGALTADMTREQAVADSRPLAPPLLRNVQREAGRATGEVSLDPLADPFLVQHRLRGKPLLPVVVGLEALAEAAAATGARHVAGFRRVQMLDGLLFHTDRPAVAQARVVARADGMLDCELTCDFRNRAGDVIQKDRPYLRAALEWADAPPALTAELPPAPTAWTDFAYPERSPMFHGAAFRGVTATCFDEHGGWARIASLPLADLVGESRVVGWTIPSVVLDSALYACGIHLWVHGQGAISLPKAIERLQLGRPARRGESCLVHFVCRQITSDSACYDFTVVGEDRSIIVAAQGYQKVILQRGGAA